MTRDRTFITYLGRLFCRMSSASSSTVTAYNARRHISTTPTPSSSRAAAARARRSPSSVSGDSVVHQSYPGRGPGGPAGRGGGNTSPGTTTPRASDNGGHAPGNGDVNNHKKNRMPITPAVLRNIFARSRTLFEERSISRVAFFRCVQISFFKILKCYFMFEHATFLFFFSIVSRVSYLVVWV